MIKIQSTPKALREEVEVKGREGKGGVKGVPGCVLLVQINDICCVGLGGLSLMGSVSVLALLLELSPLLLLSFTTSRLTRLHFLGPHVPSAFSKYCTTNTWSASEGGQEHGGKAQGREEGACREENGCCC